MESSRMKTPVKIMKIIPIFCCHWNNRDNYSEFFIVSLLPKSLDYATIIRCGWNQSHA